MKIPRWFIPQAMRDATRLGRRYSLLELINGNAISFSQYGEDLMLETCFFMERRTGFYVDVGAFDPFNLSNTHLFYRKGWQGINIEPNPLGFRRFEKYRRRDINLNLAVSSTEKEVEFTIDYVYSGIDDDLHSYRGRNSRAKQITVLSQPLRSILDRHLPANTVIDFLTIDCEGHDRIVLESNDWERYRPKVVLIEDLSCKIGNELDASMMGRGYDFFRQLNFTKIFVNRSNDPRN
jgi:FkbM family methyltransferase